MVYLAYGFAKSLSKGLDPFNDVPNAVRIALGVAGGYVFVKGSSFVLPSLGIFLVVAGVFLNDEYQRRTLYSLRKGRRGGSVALLGIDGSGKSTHSAELEAWMRRSGYTCELVPFHRYLFVDLLSKSRGAGAATGERKRGNPLRPLLSLADNLLLNLLTSAGTGIEGKVVIYDRYIWSTYVKYHALGYPVSPLRRLYTLPRPKVGVVLDIPVSRSLQVIGSRRGHIPYRAEVLEEERKEYLRIARDRGYLVVDSTHPFAEVQDKIQKAVERAFPHGGGTR
jgi:thymidylate kinase